MIWDMRTNCPKEKNTDVMSVLRADSFYNVLKLLIEKPSYYIWIFI